MTGEEQAIWKLAVCGLTVTRSEGRWVVRDVILGIDLLVLTTLSSLIEIADLIYSLEQGSRETPSA
jgi:hypothetical protein